RSVRPGNLDGVVQVDAGGKPGVGNERVKSVGEHTRLDRHKTVRTQSVRTSSNPEVWRQYAASAASSFCFPPNRLNAPWFGKDASFLALRRISPSTGSLPSSLTSPTYFSIITVSLL